MLQHPAVAECAVIGIADAKWGERPLALVVKKPGADVTEEAIRDLVAGYAEKGIISRYGVPENITFVESLPRTSVGKLDKKVMRAEHGG